MSLFSRFPQAPSPVPSEHPSPEVLMKFEKSVGEIRRVEQLSKFLCSERNRRRLSLEQIEIIQRRLGALAGEVHTDAHRKTVEQCEKQLDDLRARLENGEAANKEHSNEGGMAARLGLGIGASILGIFGLRSIVRHGPLGPVRGLFRGVHGVAGGGGRLGLGTLNIARRNPIMTALLAGLGIGATVQVREYINQNSDALTRELEAIARENGESAENVAQRSGKRLADFIRSAGSSTVNTFVKGIVFVFRGTIDPATGAVTLPHSSLRPAFWVAYQAGQRSRFSSGKIWRTAERLLPLGMRNRTEQLIGRADMIGAQSNDRARVIDQTYKQINAERDPVKRAALERRLAAALNVEINVDTGKRLRMIAAEAEALHKQNLSAFGPQQERIRQDIQRVEDNIRTGRNIPTGTTVEKYKLAERQRIDNVVKAQFTELEKRKIDLGNQFVAAASAHTKSRLDAAGGGVLDATRKTMENTGYKFARIPGGKWVVKAAVGYSLLPLGMEFASAFTNTLEGNPKLKRLEARKAKGERLTENEGRELQRLKNQWVSVGLDAGQIAGGFIPVVGEVLDFKAAITGKDLNGRDLSTVSRVTSGVMGTLGAASLLLAPFTFGGSAVAFRAIRGGTAAGKALSKVKNVNQGINALHQSTKFIDTTRAAGTLSTAQKAAMGARSAITTARSGMQVFSYGLLGYHLGAGAVDFAQTSAKKIEDWRTRAAEFTEHAVDGIRSDVPRRRMRGQSPEESAHGEAA